MSRLKILVILAVLGGAAWQGYLFWLKRGLEPGTYRLNGKNKPCSYFGDGQGAVEEQRHQALRAKKRAEKAGDIEEVEYQLGQIEELDAALRYCW